MSPYDDEQVDLHREFELEGAERPSYLVLEAERQLAQTNVVRKQLALSNGEQWHFFRDNTRPPPAADHIALAFPESEAVPPEPFSIASAVGRHVRNFVADAVRRSCRIAGGKITIT